ncbi:pentapeptide repeat-containing protein [Streptomyces atroolivaceus]|uniref:Pentapeptide repeat-containing protein n=1 Tax=Streptomyces atroolivaceus TaxID=66869 RepID=A0ABV9VDK8_STRAZ|nr:pentapeptide repeat-containing protein [Streptomyces atroolivaceus]
MKKEFGARQLRRLALRRTAGRRSRQRRRKAETSGPKARGRLDWLGLMVVSLPGLAALAALLFTWMQVGQANKQLRISEQGQITNRFNAAVTNLGSASVDVRLGGVYGLERIMQDSVRDHPTVVSVLTAYVRRHAPLPEAGARKQQTASPAVSLPTDIEAAMGVLAKRPLAVETFVLDVNRTDLRGLRSGHGGSRFAGMIFQEADLTGANLNGADLSSADLTRTVLRSSSLAGARLSVASLTDADLTGANLNKAELTSADLTDARLTGAELNGAVLGSAILKRTTFRTANLNGADLTGADLSGANLSGARLTYANLAVADLTGADLTEADLTGADLTGAILTDARLTGAKLKGVRGLPPSQR